MFIVHVFVHVKEDQIDAFKEATKENANSSAEEPGIARFDVIQQLDDPTRFVALLEFDDEDAKLRFLDSDAFAEYRDGATGRFSAPPKPTQVRLVASTRN